MKLFINAGVCERLWNDDTKIKELPNGELQLKIPNYLEEKRKHEYITFVLPHIRQKVLEEKDVTIDSLSLKHTSKNTFKFSKSENSSEEYMYAIVRSTEIVPDDVFIPANMKNAVEVIKRIRFVDGEVDYGSFLSNVYVIKIKLDIDESLSIYLKNTKPHSFDKHYVVYRAGWSREYHVTRKYETYILLNDKNRKDYISLSELCE